MLEGGRVLAVFFLVFLLTETGVQIVGQLTGWCKPAAGAGQPTQHTTLQYQGQQDQKVDNKAVLGTITSHCLPKLVCQLYSLQSREHISDSERNLINLIGSVGLTGFPSKYSYAAHMGQLVRGVLGQGCHNFYPSCPFSSNDVIEIARRINFS
ncbi:uncharacterized protein LOC111704289 isoform X1 [Eurytemora carolleeae]|uniref:uncharacterized protein LOC111704289 isoform X1 n=1 Tax=Eurytemora carolleeae TaxID=1294199 RepID=UPI000C7625DD|nr:uncharacterized protein LOC111704289 isoform X1 [Eurytemora carolleeae]|eukprot:XP_023332266.1 uncharacterized protein LOC111704289 isoform X1 [Eurytemora affinis]